MVAIVLALLVIMLGALAAGLSVASTMGLAALSVGWLFSPRPLWNILAYLPWNLLTSSTLVALPLFVLMGEMLLRAGVSEDMYRALSKWLGRLPGGLVHTNIVASGVFACISGSSAATAATIGGVALPYMRARSYDDRLVLGSIAAGGTLGILIPPSLVMIVYGVLAEVSVGRLYLAGFVPGLVLMLAFVGVILVTVWINPAKAPRETSASWREKVTGLIGLVPVFLLIFLVLGTIYLGIATATEAAAFGVTGAFLLALGYRRLNAAMLQETFLATAATTGMIMLILVAAVLLQFVVSFLGIPAAVANTVVAHNLSPMQLVLAICVLYLILGMFMDSLSMVVITIPILLPVMRALNIDMVWFGIVVVILVELALVTPPVGINLFILQALAKRAYGDEARSADVIIGVIPFLVAMVLTLAAVLAFPELALWLPDQAKGL